MSTNSIDHDQPSGLRVCQVLLGKGFGGAERLFVDLTLELQQAGVDVLPICSPDSRTAAELKATGTHCALIQEASSRDPLASWRISRAVGKHGSQLVHTHLSRASRLTSRARLKIPQVASIHNYGRWKYYKGADYYMPVSRYGASYIESQQVSKDRIQVMSNFTRIPVLGDAEREQLYMGLVVAVVCGRAVGVCSTAGIVALSAVLGARCVPKWCCFRYLCAAVRSAYPPPPAIAGA